MKTIVAQSNRQQLSKFIDSGEVAFNQPFCLLCQHDATSSPSAIFRKTFWFSNQKNPPKYIFENYVPENYFHIMFSAIFKKYIFKKYIASF